MEGTDKRDAESDRDMRVIQVNSSVRGGGASNASWRLHVELKQRGLDSRLWAGVGDEPDSDEIYHIRGYPFTQKVLRALFKRIGLNCVEILSTFHLHRHPWLDDSTVLHLHNLHGGHFNYLALPRLLRAHGGHHIA